MNRTVAWVVVGVLVLAGAVTAVVVLPGDDEAARPVAGYDLSSPRRAAQSFADAAIAGDPDALLELTCVAHADCVAGQGRVSPEQVEQAKRQIVDGLPTLADRLRDAEFGAVREAVVPGGTEVELRSPAVPADGEAALVFVELDGDWLYAGSVGAAS